MDELQIGVRPKISGALPEIEQGVENMTKLSGSCLCGEVAYSADTDVKMIINCHCSDCQKATGSVHGTLVFIEEDALSINGNPSGFDHPADSGSTLTKLFCSKCGSQLFGRNTNRPGMIGIRAGTLDQKELIKPGVNIYCGSAIASTPMDPDLKAFEKMPG